MCPPFQLLKAPVSTWKKPTETVGSTIKSNPTVNLQVQQVRISAPAVFKLALWNLQTPRGRGLWL